MYYNAASHAITLEEDWLLAVRTEVSVLVKDDHGKLIRYVKVVIPDLRTANHQHTCRLQAQ